MKSRLLLIPLIVLVGCTNKGKGPDELVNETPDAIEESSSYGFRSSYKGGRWKENIIERLFEEASEKNKKVGSINEHILTANEIYRDSLKEYYNYVNVNEDYWNVANSYISKIEDSLLRKSVKKTFEHSELAYCDAKKDLLLLKDKIELERVRFNDQVNVLKLLVTLPMIQNYQKNELPDSLKLNSILNAFSNTSDEIKVYLK